MKTAGSCALAVAVLIAWGMKRHYADARADDLRWILSPTARLVGVDDGHDLRAAAGRRLSLAGAPVPDREVVRGDQLHDRRVRHAGRSPSFIARDRGCRRRACSV